MKKHTTLKLKLFIPVILLLLNHIFCLGGQTVLKGGCAKVNITPPIGTQLDGFGSRERPCDGIEDELYAKALVFDDGQNTLAIVSTDLVSIPLEITNHIREIVKEKIGIPETNVLICASHTHYGPMIYFASTSETSVEVDKSYVQILIKKIAGSVLIAYKNMKEIKVGAVKGEIPEIVYNRRTRRIDGSVKVTWNVPDSMSVSPPIIEERVDDSGTMTYVIPSADPELVFGPVDPEVCILRVEDMSGEIIGSIVNFACHPTSGSIYSGNFVSNDFPTYATQVVEQIEGGICLFAQGTGGNMAAISRTMKKKHPRLQMGKALGGEVLRRLQFVSTTDDVTLKSLKKTINFHLKPDWIEKVGESKKYATTEIQVFRIGDIFILGLPGEILVEIGLDIKNKAGIENLFIISLSNDGIGHKDLYSEIYVCPSEAYEEGGYESEEATHLAKGAGEIMIKEALDIIDRIK